MCDCKYFVHQPDESQPIPVNPIDIPEIPVHVKKILDMRDALVQEDYDEVYHILYSIASPNFDKLEPWEELEKKSEWQPPIPVNQDDYWKKRYEAAEKLLFGMGNFFDGKGSFEDMKSAAKDWVQLKSVQTDPEKMEK